MRRIGIVSYRATASSVERRTVKISACAPGTQIVSHVFPKIQVSRMVILHDAKISLVRLVIKPAKVKPSVVESVVTQLQGGLYGKCMRAVVSVSNYTVEVRTQSITEQIFYCNSSILGRSEENQIHLGAGAP